MQKWKPEIIHSCARGWAELGAINQPVRLQCDGWGAPIPANIDSSRAAKDTSPIIYRTKNRAKRVFMVEARFKPAGRAPPASRRAAGGATAGIMMATVQAVMINVHVLPSHHGDRAVVDPLDMRLPKDRIYGFLGPNGCGKITTLRMLCGLRTPDAGEGTCIKLACRKPGD